MTRLVFLALYTLLWTSESDAFAPLSLGRQQQQQWQRFSALDVSTSVKSSSHESSGSSSISPSRYPSPDSLPPELRKLTTAFGNVSENIVRHKQLLYMADQLAPMDRALMTPENKVPGCLSTVHVDGTATWDPKKKDYIIDYVGDSDGLLTKGLVAFLVRGLSGSTATEIQRVDPEFIREAKIEQSLTPGRNNGFLNMLATMKKKALELVENAKKETSVMTESNSSDETNDNDDEIAESKDRPMYNGMIKALKQLDPIQLELTDNSAQHEGHAGSVGYNGESHFSLQIVSGSFEGLNLIKRHQLIYETLSEYMPKIHALQIRANTPEEVAK